MDGQTKASGGKYNNQQRRRRLILESGHAGPSQSFVCSTSSLIVVHDSLLLPLVARNPPQYHKVAERPSESEEEGVYSPQHERQLRGSAHWPKRHLPKEDRRRHWVQASHQRKVRASKLSVVAAIKSETRYKGRCSSGTVTKRRMGLRIPIAL